MAIRKLLCSLLVTMIVFIAQPVYAATKVEVVNTPTQVDVKSANNAASNALYRPTLSELPALAGFAREQSGVDIVNFDTFDVDWSTPVKQDASREKEILGYDILVRNESYNASRRSISFGPECTLDYESLVMMIYKALGQDIIHYQVASKSLTEISVFVTRSRVDDYWEQARSDSLIYGDSQRTQTPTFYEFCVLLRNMMYMYGESELREEETAYLMQVYGAKIPGYISADERDALKYLLVRGIVDDPEPEFTMDVVLTTLMRVADEGSRLTYKNIQLTANTELLSKGYFPIEVSDKQSVSILSTNVSYTAAQTYDYFVEVADGYTLFKDVDTGFANPNVYVSANPGSVSSSPLEDSSYLGIETYNGVPFYHFRAPIDYTSPLTINSGNLTDLPLNYSLESGGGWYFVRDREGEDMYKRTPFSESDDMSFVDKERKAQPPKKDVLLAPNSTPIEEHITLDTSVAEFGWTASDGTTYPIYEWIRLGIAKECTEGHSNCYVFDTASAADLEAIKVEYTTPTSKDIMYVNQDTDQYLVSLNWLKSVTGLSLTVSPVITGNDTLYQVYVSREGHEYGFTPYVLIDKKRNSALVNNMLIDFPKDTDLIIDEGAGYFLNIDIITPWMRGDMVIIRGEDGVATIAKINGIGELSSNYVVESFNYISAGGQGFVELMPASNTMSLTGSACGLNYMIYRNPSYLSDRLFVFTLESLSGMEDGTTALNNLGYKDLPDGWKVYTTLLRRESGSDENAAIGVNYFPETDTYTCSAPSSLGIPIEISSRSVTYPGTSTAVVEHDVNYTASNPTTGVSDVLFPVGAAQQLFSTAIIPWDVNNEDCKQIMNVENRLFLGAVSSSYDPSTGKFVWMEGNGTKHFYTPSANDTFVKVFSSGRIFYTLRASAIERVVEESTSEENNTTGHVLSLEELGIISTFDWDSFNFETAIQNADDLLTILILYTLQFLPRLFMFMFMALLTLSVISNIKFVIIFCDKVFDPYSFLTFGRQNVHTISIKHMFIASLACFAAFGLFWNLTILRLISWLEGALLSILTMR